MSAIPSTEHDLVRESATQPFYRAAEVAHFIGAPPRLVRAWFRTDFDGVRTISFVQMLDMLRRHGAFTGEVVYENGIPIRWYPRGSDYPVAIDPGITSGTPIIARRGIGTRFIALRALGGEPLNEIADDYRLTMDEARAALEFEQVTLPAR